MKIVGHKKQWDFLKKSALINKLSHAYLFAGEEGLGKKTLGVEFIKFLNCQCPEFFKKPCGNCRSCRDIDRRIYPDFLILEPVEKEIQISQIRKLCQHLSFKPYASSFKAAIINGAEKLTQEAANSLLKTLEELSGKGILILVSSNSEAVLPTLVSRTQVIKFFKVPEVEIKNHLKKEGLKEEEIAKFVLASEGAPGRMMDFLACPEKLGEEKEELENFIKISRSGLIYRFQYINKITKDESLNLTETLNLWLKYFRNLLLANLSADNKENNFSAFLSGIGGESSRDRKYYSIPKLKKIVKALDNTIFLISSTNVNPKLALEVFMMDL